MCHFKNVPLTAARWLQTNFKTILNKAIGLRHQSSLDLWTLEESILQTLLGQTHWHWVCAWPLSMGQETHTHKYLFMPIFLLRLSKYLIYLWNMTLSKVQNGQKYNIHKPLKHGRTLREQMEHKQSLLSFSNKVHHLFYYPTENENVASLLG